MDPLRLALEVPGPRRSADVAVLVRRTSALIAAGVPLTLLLDLGEPTGPHSAERFVDEPADVGWVPGSRG